MTRNHRLALILTALAYTAFFLCLTSTPYTDAPNHLARAVIMNSLWFDAHSPYQTLFAARHFFMPYLLPDLGLILAIRVLGVNLAGPVWSTLTMLALASAVSFYARRILTTPWAIACAAFCSWYLATNYLFILGFFSFQWGLAAAFLALGALEEYRRTARPFWFALYAAACLACYGSHMACLAMLAATVALIGSLRVLRNRQRATRLLAELLPFALLAIYHLALVPHSHTSLDPITRSTLFDKFGHFLEALFVRRNYVLERCVLALFWIILAYALRRRVRLQTHWELATTCALAAAIYFILPFGLGGVFYVDERALPFFFIPLLILALRILEDSQPGPRPIAILQAACALLALSNLAALALFLPLQNHQVAQFREALSKIPSGKTVLPIHTRRRDGSTYPLRHAASFYLIESQGYVPYLFSQSNPSGPAGYFTDLSPIYQPPQNWYMTKLQPDWEKIAQTYDYVIITKPWKAARIDLSHLEFYYDNPIATVFKVHREKLGTAYSVPGSAFCDAWTERAVPIFSLRPLNPALCESAQPKPPRPEP